MSLIENALADSLNQHELIGIHTNRRDISRFALGWITGLTDDGYCLNTVDAYGGPDVVQVGHIENILKVTRKGPYIEGIAAIIASNPAFSSSSFNYGLANMKDVIEDLRDKRRVLTVLDEDGWEITGLILNLDETALELKTFSKVGIYDGDEIIRIDDIFKLEFFGRQQRVLESILDFRKD